jgi:uncharacterized Zn finger protein
LPYKDPEKRREKQNEYNQKYYANNPSVCKARSQAQRVNAKRRWAEFKATLSCVKCGFAHPTALDFHHVVSSPDNVHLHKLIRNNAYRRALEEIKKCIVLCANCHRIHHNDEYLRKKAELQTFVSTQRKTPPCERGL